MDLERRVYRLSPSQLSAETIAVTFAKTSRSPESFDVIAAELDDEKSARFSEKWIVGYGHSSVAEHAVIHLAMENVSRLAIENIESNRLASYTEKSTRYQEWNPKAFVVPDEIQASPLKDEYLRLMEVLFSTYAQALQALKPWSEATTPREEGESEKAWANRARVKAVDVARFILPAASMANVGVTMNARVLEYAIKKMLSSELAEIRMIGAETKCVAMQELPTLIKYTDPIPYLTDVRKAFTSVSRSIDTIRGSEWCNLLDADPYGEAKVLAGVLYRFGDDSYSVGLDQVQNMDDETRQALAAKLFEHIGNHDQPLRELEYADYTFDLVMDQGAYFEFKRHRMMSQTPQALTTYLGYALPRGIVDAGFEEKFVSAMEQAHTLYTKIAENLPAASSYVVPNAYNRRVLCRLNLREAFHFCKLRSAGNAHFSIRRIARAMYEKIVDIHPVLASFMALDEAESSLSISTEYFSAVEKYPAN
ncbi:MAG TPA: FAD-dependent thymidylate synthase [Anaerolineaceae bacterium]|nr:FAD-dependent thymidylate synthase [Anaerolineaceae bacterium]